MLEKLKTAGRELRKNIRVYSLAMKDPRTPRLARWLLWLATAYLLSPIDLMPDFVPVLGQIDDVLIVPLLFFTAMRIVPKEVVEDCRIQVTAGRKQDNQA
ncbi:MAG TPA: DUF1232 domain-containing protein [Sedimentisphaerales bacterium]|nr:DUF1232 domain-containing protein [Sedimentisphaerales bacterium]